MVKVYSFLLMFLVVDFIYQLYRDTIYVNHAPILNIRFDKFWQCLLPSSRHPNQEIKHFIIPESCAPCSHSLPPATRLPTRRHPRVWPLSPQVSCAVLELCINGIIPGCTLLCLAYLTQHHSLEIHRHCCPVLRISSLPLFTTEKYSVDRGSQHVCPVTRRQTLGCFLVWAIVNKAAISTCVHVFLQTYVFISLG